MRLIVEPAFTVTVRIGLLRFMRRIADEIGVSRLAVLDEARTVLARDEALAGDLTSDES
jgi:hypothetical protein